MGRCSLAVALDPLCKMADALGEGAIGAGEHCIKLRIAACTPTDMEDCHSTERTCAKVLQG